MPVVFFGCDTIGPQLTRDAGEKPADAGVSRDGGLRQDAGALADAGPTMGVGTKLATLPVELLGVLSDPDEVLYLRADGTAMAASADGTRNVDLGVRPNVISQPRRHLWLWTEVSDAGAQGVLHAHRSGTATTSAIAERVATDFFVPNHDSEWAIIAASWTAGASPSEDATATLELVRADGRERRTLLPRFRLGHWNAATLKHEGPCIPSGVFSSARTALLTLCVGSSTATPARDLLAIDLVTGEVRSKARNVLAYVGLATDGTFALFADEQLRLYAIDAEGRAVVPVEDTRPVRSLRFLDGARFAYVTSAQQLLVSAWPDLEPELVVSSGVADLEVASPTGGHIMFHQSVATSGLRDLWLVATASPAIPLLLEPELHAYPGDDAFSRDGRSARWFADADESYIGDLYVRPADGSTPRTLLAPRAWFVLNYADPSRVLLLSNAELVAEGRRIVADLATRDGDASEALEVLVPRVDARFALFPGGDRVAYVLPEGPSAGLWVLEL